MPSLSRHFGELFIDHTNSPGTKEVPQGTTLTAPHFQCVHCERIVIMARDRTRDRHVCKKCMRYTCDTPGCVNECYPWMRVAEAIIERPEDTNITLRRTRDGGLLFNPAVLDKYRIL